MEPSPGTTPNRKGFLIGGIIGVLSTVVIICAVLYFIGLNLPENQENTKSNPISATLPTGASSTTTSLLSSSKYPYQQVVQIFAEVEINGKDIDLWSGSGSVISSDGLILTNAHVAFSDEYQVKRLRIGLTRQDDAPPEDMYYAEVVQIDADLDLAVIRIAYDLQGKMINRDSLNLPFVTIGNSDELQLGDSITILGYPGIGGETITLTQGEVSGFTAEKAYGRRAFIKTSATIAGGNSGGMTLNRELKLIGVPTQLGSGSQKDQEIDCRAVNDTNGDGVVDEKDICVPMGGFINALRPVNLAIPMIDAAKRGEVVAIDSFQAPEPINANHGIIYQDDFSDENSGWPVQSDATGSVGYFNDKFFIEVDEPTFYNWVNGGENLSDVVINVNTEVVQSTGNGEYGLICRYQDNDNFYLLTITENSLYAIIMREKGSWVNLVDYSGFDRQSDPKYSKIEASCIGNTLKLSVNGEILDQVKDNTFKNGDYGMIVGTDVKSGLRIAFDDLIVRQP
jgi:S1-C subfamily serine protease